MAAPRWLRNAGVGAGLIAAGATAGILASNRGDPANIVGPTATSQAAPEWFTRAIEARRSVNSASDGLGTSISFEAKFALLRKAQSEVYSFLIFLRKPLPQDADLQRIMDVADEINGLIITSDHRISQLPKEEADAIRKILGDMLEKEQILRERSGHL